MPKEEGELVTEEGIFEVLRDVVGDENTCLDPRKEPYREKET